MLKIERQNIIDMELNKQGYVLVPALSELFRCSEETVRRDLKEMESEGRLVRTHGGAYLVEKFDKSYPTNLRKAYYQRSKDRMARQVLKYVNENDVVMLDSSTTCLSIAEAFIQSGKSLTIITNSLLICTLCNESQSNINLISLGGEFRRRTTSFTNQHTVDMLKYYHADSCFISCPKLTCEYGLSDNHLSEANVRACMLEQSEFKCVVADHTKFNSSANILFPGIESLDVILTDHKLDTQWETFAKTNNIKLEYCIE